MNASLRRELQQRIAAAAAALRVESLTEWDQDSPQAHRAFRAAAAVIGAAEAAAMTESAAVAAAGDEPVALLDGTAFTAAGMGPAQHDSADLMWVLWSISRARAHLTTMSGRQDRCPNLAASTSLIDVVHAYLSAEVYLANGEADLAEECLAVGRQKLDAVIEQDQSRR